mmetsp:Transcript_6948/g.9233  ORF Transcript_6948/g.9233 Transcript_6948/m.9233 type:complete len:128 (-) Transcript_6948:12-395(-)|eukprot:CAMPEP_0184650248 /NCGR_PEP_ID=MMETSP0308-20130426/7762_1 /TAXON_ID=38269 /ORGANISM="Gloeochaete witrockiana, Strain SAG 46.84" /LENGTH=127 /DNA_ID=CAMNT_0027083633 /DNA_START=131 /DNA_END=514 /DNA_ORIENTATION=-
MAAFVASGLSFFAGSRGKLAQEINVSSAKFEINAAVHHPFSRSHNPAPTQEQGPFKRQSWLDVPELDVNEQPTAGLTLRNNRKSGNNHDNAGADNSSRGMSRPISWLDTPEVSIKDALKRQPYPKAR